MQATSLWKFRGFATTAIALGIGAASLAFAGTAASNGLSGRWTATIKQGSIVIPFRLDLSVSGDTVTGKLYNGWEDYETTSSAKIENGKVQLNFEHYLTTITAEVKDGELDGQVTVQHRSPINITPGAYKTDAHDYVSPFHATRYTAVAETAEAANVPNIDGVWELPYESPKGEKAFRLIVKQKGAEISASILRVDGDTGALTGGWKDGKFVASHFDGSRPGLIEITPKADGTLNVGIRAEPRNLDFVAYRPEVARAKGLPEPANYLTHTTVRDPNEVFVYNFPDVNGKPVSNEDPRFKGKVVLAIVTGTWCPNCHDEARYLVELYKKYHDQGLEVVALDFEEADQQKSLTRVNAFIKQYGVPYTYLIAGTPDEMWDKVPQAVNLNTWPATLFIGRDGRVKATYSGFAGSASGVYNSELKERFVSTIDRLLKESPVEQTAQVVAR
ncbi:MAG: TlpA disulfide reductase family protein [Bryobacteraceae bacterium]|jgi:thiol-disulfide isomerase/thioredoxin